MLCFSPGSRLISWNGYARQAEKSAFHLRNLKVLFDDIGEVFVHDDFNTVVAYQYLVHTVVTDEYHIGLPLNKSREEPAGVPKVLPPF
jgi:hypothetical protein